MRKSIINTIKNLTLLLILILSCSSASLGQSQQYQVGIPVNDTLSSFVIASTADSCLYDISLNPIDFSISGIDIYLVVDTIMDPSNTVLVNPIGPINIGDTIPLPSSLAVGYTFKFPGGTGSYANCRLMAKGTPTVAGEKSICNNYTTYITALNCQNGMEIIGSDTCEVLSAVGIKTFENIKLNIYPNPSTNFLNIEFETQPTNANIQIYTAQGKLIYAQQNISTINSTINTSNFSTGLYSIIISNGERLLSTYKFIKE